MSKRNGHYVGIVVTLERRVNYNEQELQENPYRKRQHQRNENPCQPESTPPEQGKSPTAAHTKNCFVLTTFVIGFFMKRMPIITRVRRGTGANMRMVCCILGLGVLKIGVPT